MGKKNGIHIRQIQPFNGANADLLSWLYFTSTDSYLTKTVQYYINI